MRISAIEDAGDRAVMTQGLIEAAQTMEEGSADAQEEANSAIETAVKKITSLSKEKQEELQKALKVRKHAAMAAVAGGGRSGLHCNRCGRSNTHDTIDCFADTTVSGAPCTGPIAQGAAASKYARTRAGRDFAGPRESTYAGAAFFPPPPPLMQQGLAGAYGTYGAARGQCRRCGREGHYESACPQNPYNANRAPTAPAQQQQSGAGVSARWTTTDYTHARASDMHNTTTYTNDTAMGDVRRQDSEGWRCC